ncbi:hypothetical protein PV379_10675 [Streptomyces caniscabiei]|uniref:hypothetical protein n=1 Tax=Streptomyces caniscabiei TaxID=2746961 RepID=UPI0029B07B33|nr:hypothetical protein [Streptomyces caniscabiei]MDX2601949.1 hypothetical protein [Streptomyces caniscabiei]MDX2737384.1 hypothetical protein [Streptomyces caniscabiei]MDX2777773.1 hypothetical protein [Streptomyces caniscabiei]
MATPTPGEPVSEAAEEAVQTSVMATRLVMAIADAVRRHQQKKNKGQGDAPPSADEAAAEASASVKNRFPADLSAALMGEGDWPQMAQQLVALRQAGVDLETILPRMGEIAVTVRDQVAANTQQVAREGTGEWERTLRETLPAGPVREAILSSPTWPDIAATMARLDERGVDVRQILATAHDEGLSVDQAVAKALSRDAEPAVSRDAQLSYGPLTTGLDLPRDLDLSNRERVLKQLSISPLENSRYAQWAREAMRGHEQEAGLLVAARHWPLVAAQMAQAESEGKPVRAHLARLMKDRSWEEGPGPQLGARLAQAAADSLRRPLGDTPTETATKVNATAARAQSPSLDLTRRQAKGAAPTEAGVAAHRQTGPAPAKGRTK